MNDSDKNKNSSRENAPVVRLMKLASDGLELADELWRKSGGSAALAGLATGQSAKATKRGKGSKPSGPHASKRHREASGLPEVLVRVTTENGKYHHMECKLGAAGEKATIAAAMENGLTPCDRCAADIEALLQVEAAREDEESVEIPVRESYDEVNPDVEVFVYATDKGAKYHNEDCGFAEGADAITLLEAKERGLQPCAHCHDIPEPKPKSKPKKKASPSKRVGSKSKASGMVYVTDEGEKYHRKDCPYAEDAKKIALTTAQERGLQPCAHCHDDD